MKLCLWNPVCIVPGEGKGNESMRTWADSPVRRFRWACGAASDTCAVCALTHSWSDCSPVGDSWRVFLCKGHSLQVPFFWWTRSPHFLVFSLGWPSGKLIFTAWNWLSFVFLPFIHRCLRKKLRKIRQKFASTSWSNNISRNYWDLLKGCLSQREASGLTVDASGLNKRLDCPFLGEAPRLLPTPELFPKGRTLNALPLPGLCSSGLRVDS